jgi:outer membrane protein
MTLRIAAAAGALAIFAMARAAFGAPAPATPSPMPTPATIPAGSSGPVALTLTQAEDIALASSPALAFARAQYAQAAAGIGSARSGALPNLAITGSTSRSKSSNVNGNSQSGTGNGTSGGPTFFTSTSASLGLRQLIVDGGRIRAATQAARFSTDAARLNLERQIQTVQFNVAQSYYLALQARHQLITAQDTLNLAQVQEKLVNAQYKAGVVSNADVLTAQLPVAQAQLAVAQAQNGEQTQLALLLDTMGLPAQTSVSIADEGAGSIPVPGLLSLLDTAQKQRPDLLAAQASFDAANASVRAARLGLFPTVSGTGSDGTARNVGNSYSLGFNLSFPLFDGGLTRAQTASAQAAADQAAANLKTAQLLVSLNVQQAYLGILTAQAGLNAAQVEYSQARTVLDVTNAQYKSGVTTLPLLLNAQVGLSKAESDRVNALYSYKTAWQQLLLAEGVIGQ